MTKTIHTAKAARDFDSYSISELGIPSLVLMEHAAEGICSQILKHYPDSDFIAVYCGPGNNGADGLALCRLLALAGKHPVFLIDPDARLSEDEKIQLRCCRALGIPEKPLDFYKDVKDLEKDFDLIADALFGSGLNRPLSDTYADLALMISESSLPVVSVDIPSGINGNTGKGEPCVKADLTLALDCMKTGHLLNEGKKAAGEIEAINIGIPEWLHEEDPEKILLIDKDLAAKGLPIRSDLLNKGRFGKILMTGGSLNMQGALSMAAKSCFHSGIGTLTLFAPESAAKAVASKMDLAMIIPSAEIQGYFDVSAAGPLEMLLEKYTFASCGNGMGTGKGAMAITQTMLESEIGLVLDADGLNCASRHPEWLKRKAPLVLTPHLVEFSRISGFLLSDIEQDPIGCIRRFMETYPDLVLVLKSDVTFVADRTRLAILNHPSSALSKGGSGDVLCGLVCGLCAQSDDLFSSCCSAVWIHNHAADVCLQDDERINPACFTPLDLIKGYSPLFNELEKHQKKEAEDSFMPL